MSLEVKVYRDFRSYTPKIMFGLTGRQLVLLVPTVLLAGVVWAVAYVTGHTDLGVPCMMVAITPLVLFGWYRRMGLPFDKWLRVMHRYGQAPKEIMYSHSGIGIYDEQKLKGSSRRAISAWEKQN